MDINIIIEAIRFSNNLRLLNSERGYQGEFHRHLANIFFENEIFSEQVLVEEEYQKSLRRHGIRFRPDLIVHIPVEVSNEEDRTLNNFIVFEFKLNSDKNAATEDFGKLEQMFERLNYSTGFFINIQGYPNSFLRDFDSNFKDRINEISISYERNSVYIRHDYYLSGELKTRAMCLNT